MRVLITGIAGFIGSHLAERLSDEGHQVGGVDNFTTGRLSNWPNAVECDITRRRSLYDYGNRFGPELVIHCGASYRDPTRWHRDVEVNVAGTINVCNLARYHRARIVYFQTALPPISSYAISKIAGEHYIRLHDRDALIFRLANIYGPRNFSGPIPAFYKRLSAGERCTVVQTGRDMVYVDDLVACVLQALGEQASGTYDVCSGELTPILSLYRQVARHFPGTYEPKRMMPGPDDVPTILSVNARLPGWRPAVELEEGIAEAISWYAGNGVGDTYTHLQLKEGVS